MLELQRQEAKAEVYLKERHEREFIAAYIGHKAGSRKDQTRHQAMILDRTMWMTREQPTSIDHCFIDKLSNILSQILNKTIIYQSINT